MTPPDWTVTLVDENIAPAVLPEADLVGITSFTSTINRAYELATAYRDREVPVVMGGIHPTMVSEEARQFADSVVRGEAEALWPQVLQDAEGGCLKPIYEGRPELLSDLPHPRRDLFDPCYAWGTLQTSRGCPMDCHFCSVTAFNGRRFRQRPVADVLDELATIPQRNIFFVDDNLLGYGRQAEARAIQLFRGMVERGLRKRFACQTSLNFADNPQVLKWAQKAGCKMIFVGLESVSEGSLESMGKSYNLKKGTGQYAACIRRCHAHGIGVIGALIFGSDQDDPRIFERTLHFIRTSGLDVIQITFATPLPGTRFFEQLQREGRLTHTDFPEDWKAYSFSRILFRTRGMSAEDLYLGMVYVKDHLYTPIPFVRRALRTLLETRDLATAAMAYKLNKGYRRGYLETAYFQPYSSMHRQASSRQPAQSLQRCAAREGAQGSSGECAVDD
jgi:radical SAM superfamily enzyme YgiQ (UPF0313 family)